MSATDLLGMRVVLTVTGGGEIRTTLGEVIESYRDDLALEEIDHVCTALELGESCKFGGGAVPRFSICREEKSA